MPWKSSLELQNLPIGHSRPKCVPKACTCGSDNPQAHSLDVLAMIPLECAITYIGERKIKEEEGDSVQVISKN